MGFVNVWDELDFWMMTALIVTPAAFALGLLFIPSRRTETIRWWTLLGTLATFVLTCLVFVDFLQLTDEHISNRYAQLLPARSNAVLANWHTATPVSSRDLVARRPWVGPVHVDYFIGIDGVSMALLLLSSGLFVLGCIAGWKFEGGLRGYSLVYLLFEACVLGLFLALDFVLFFAFLVVLLLLLFLLVSIWGTGRRPYAALQFALLGVLGAALILVALLALYFVDLRPYYADLDARAEQVRHDPVTPEEQRLYAFLGLAGPRADGKKLSGPINTFDLVTLAQAGQASAALDARIALAEQRLLDKSEDPALRKQLDEAEFHKIHRQALSPAFQLFCFLFLFLGFGVLMAAVPLHTWLADILEEAPAPLTLIVPGVLLSAGVYGLVRIAWPLCPLAAKELAWIVATVGVVGIVYGALLALAQTDLRRWIASCLICQSGFVLLGLAAWTTPDAAQYWSWGMKGAVFHVLSLGITAAGLGFVAGIIQERFGHTDLRRLGGLVRTMPAFTGMALVFFLALLGLPLLSGFVGPFCTMLSGWNFSPATWPAAGQVLTMIAAGSLVLIAAGVLWTVQRLFLGCYVAPPHGDDLDGRESLVAGSLVVLTVALGIWPMLVFDWLEPTVTGLVQTLAAVTAH